MTGALQSHGGDDSERCAFCSAEAAGPCASCRRSVCGDCCTLTEGGAQVWAICLACDRKGGRSLSGRWLGFGLWLLGLLVAMATLIVLLKWLVPVR